MSFRRKLNALKFNAKKAAPGIMLVVSTGLSLAAIVEFCRKTRDAMPVVDEYKETVSELTESHRITNDDAAYRKDMITETAKTVVTLGKIYAKPIALYSLSVGLNVKSYKTMRERNIALAAAYAGVGNELRRVYSRISEKYGDEALDEIKNGIKLVEIEEPRFDEKSGSEIMDKKLIPVVDEAEGYSPYARFFDEGSRLWKDNAEDNLWILMEREEEANQRLRLDGFLFLNDIYDMLDIPKTKAGNKVGWKYYPKGNNPHGDNKISFNIHNVHRPANRDFVNGYEKVILLDFNVDGEIIDSLPEI